MKKILIFPYTNQLGTTIPSLTLANLLKENNYEVIFAADGRYKHIIEEKGFKVYPINEVSYSFYRENIDNNTMKFYSSELVRFMVDAEVSLIKELNPDIVVSHNRLSLFISSKITKTKYINITIAPLTHYYNFKYFFNDNFFLSKLLPFIDINLLIPQLLVKQIFNIVTTSWVHGFNKVLSSFKLTKVKSFLDLNGSADIILLCETFGMVSLKKIPDNFLFLEQDLSSTYGSKYKWYDKVRKMRDEGKKIIFLTMGSSSMEVYPLVLKLLADFILNNSDKYILISNHCGLEEEYENKDNIFIEEFITSKDVLEFTDVVITHGGKNTLNECILSKKVIIGIPEQSEQLWNLKYAESLGVCKIATQKMLRKDPELLIKYIKHVISDDRYKKNLEKFVEIDLKRNDIIDHRSNILNAIKNLF